MAKVDLNNMEGVYFDVLREIGNIGAGNATTALAQMLNTKVDMHVPKVDLLEFSEVGEAMGGEEQIMGPLVLGQIGIDGQPVADRQIGDLANGQRLVAARHRDAQARPRQVERRRVGR